MTETIKFRRNSFLPFLISNDKVPIKAWKKNTRTKILQANFSAFFIYNILGNKLGTTRSYTQGSKCIHRLKRSKWKKTWRILVFLLFRKQRHVLCYLQKQIKQKKQRRQLVLEFDFPTRFGRRIRNLPLTIRYSSLCLEKLAISSGSFGQSSTYKFLRLGSLR